MGQSRLVSDLADIKKDLEALKSRQLIGADSLVTNATVEKVLTAAYAPNQLRQFYVSYYSSANLDPYVAELGVTLYSDHDNDPNYIMPQGSTIINDPNKRNALWGIRYDHTAASDIAGQGLKKFYIWVWNFGTDPLAAKTIYLHARMLYPGFLMSSVQAAEV
jgi:hypothetical protein